MSDNSGRACAFLRNYFYKGTLGNPDFPSVDYNEAKLAESIHIACKHVDTMREIAYGPGKDWRDVNDRQVEDSFRREKSPYFGKYSDAELRKRGYPQGQL
ncbi:MAG: hypothetical protein CMB80_24555 [Flammeovirgaceae bacterium]|nr:hypothetical protein [Flammeovirgaceae bacterium]HCX20958.1 hypothetical protein [Cytophagales bacterium]|tara:strand:+ start:197 stop:496 length:300 start_codon:yes stop_codon:yes gene_type:complete